MDRIVVVENAYSSYFEVVGDTAKQSVTVRLTEEAKKLKKGKYVITYQIYYVDAAEEMKPMTMRFTVTVK